ncbi:MAG: MFS transporter [Acetobacteraceae bacterium]|jgi:SHS family lactate transporter-like MFS transporter
MSAAAGSTQAGGAVPWYREPTKDQWLAWIAGWLGWTLDAFDFTMFLLIMVPISKEFGVPLTAVAFVLSVTLWLRLVGAVTSGWVADRIGRRSPLMVSILLYSLCNFAAGFSPNFAMLFLFRGLLGLGMGGEWPAGAALAMESWPARSRGFMSGILQGSWSLGFLFASLIYGLLFNSIGWRGMLWIGILPAFVVIYVRFFVKEPAVWAENRATQNAENRQMHTPLFSIFKPAVLGNTLTACWWMISGFIVYYSINALFATHLQKDLNLSPAVVATPVALANLLAFLAMGFWGVLADRIGRRWSMIIPAAFAIFIAPIYLLSHDLMTIIVGFTVQGLFGQAIYGQNPSYLAERFPTEVRATAGALVYHSGAFVAGFIPLILTGIATNYGVGFGISMLIGTIVGAGSFILAVLCGPETKGKVLDPKLVLA